jgi:hypothetical protein
MKMTNQTEINVKDVLKTLTVGVKVKYTNLKKSLFRMKLGSLLIKLGAKILPTNSNVEIEVLR